MRRILTAIFLSLFFSLNGLATTYYVSTTGGSVIPYTNWAMAATQIQMAVDEAINTGDVVLVNNGVYDTGERYRILSGVTNRLYISNSITVTSVNGPAATVIEGKFDATATGRGHKAIRCVFIDTASPVTISGFTLTKGASKDTTGNYGDGGGVYCEDPEKGRYAIISNCFIYGNVARLGGGGCRGNYILCDVHDNVALVGAGLTQGTYDGYCSVSRCRVYNNTAVQNGGGLWYISTLGISNCLIYNNLSLDSCGGIGGNIKIVNSTVVGNRANTNYGGAANSVIYNCIVWSNVAGGSNNNIDDSAAQYSCIEGTNLDSSYHSITNDPMFLYSATNDFRLAASSPCVDTGTNIDWMLNAVDLAGNPRIVNTTVDMGAYEYQPTSSSVSRIRKRLILSAYSRQESNLLFRITPSSFYPVGD
jgi:hypothetical protein